MLPSVSGIFIYPVKSLRGVSVAESRIDSLGLAFDRRFMVVYPDASNDHLEQPSRLEVAIHASSHRFLTQRQTPSLATITASLPDDNGMITLRSTNSDTVLQVNATERYIEALDRIRHRAVLWNETVEVADMGDDAAAFLASVLEEKDVVGDDKKAYVFYRGARLVALPSSVRRYANSTYVPLAGMQERGALPGVSLADGFPILVASTSSLEDLNRRLHAKGKAAVPMSRFRPNIVLEHVPTPFEEDTWRTVQIGDVVLHLVKACPRCTMSCTDQTTGKRSAEPLDTLKEFRRQQGVDVFFAMNALVENSHVPGKVIRVGDKVRVLSRGEPIWGDVSEPE